jgi:hypothetical protein
MVPVPKRRDAVRRPSLLVCARCAVPHFKLLIFGCRVQLMQCRQHNSRPLSRTLTDTNMIIRLFLEEKWAALECSLNSAVWKSHVQERTPSAVTSDISTPILVATVTVLLLGIAQLTHFSPCCTQCNVLSTFCSHAVAYRSGYYWWEAFLLRSEI